MNIVEQFEQEQIANLTKNKEIPDFRPGDSLKVHYRIVEGQSRIQVFEGVCIARRNRAIDSTFVVRKISHDCSVERRFPLYSPRVEKIEVVKRGVVRRAKLYYLTKLRGKAARITEKLFVKKAK